MDQPLSQASSHFPLEPIPASILAAAETHRRDAATALGLCRTGCADLDDYVLLGGFERGSVVGISAEDEETGVQLALQTLAHSLCNGAARTALVVTPRPKGVMLGALRRAVEAQVEDGEAARAVLERVMLACVFDVDGLWEVLADLDGVVSPEAHGRAEKLEEEKISGRGAFGAE
ncbi:hypothetical protein G7046_g3275 [Stylonectria norvegica]|nr:hypothetical protein G7046_g3275 [Stylonectria norvegica]